MNIFGRKNVKATAARDPGFISLTPGSSARELTAFREGLTRANRVVHPWIETPLGCDRDEIRARFRERWSVVEEPCLGKPRDYLLAGEVDRICVASTGAYAGSYVSVLLPPLRGYDAPSREQELSVIPQSLKPPPATEERYSEWYLPPPPDVGDVEKGLSTFGIERESPLASFLRHFAGLAESIDCSGSFRLPGELGLFSRDYEFFKDEYGFAKETGWDDALFPARATSRSSSVRFVD